LAKLAKIDPRAYDRSPQVYGTLHEVDDAEVATEGARRAGIKIYCYVDLYDEGQPPHVDAYTHDWFGWESKFFAEHPEYYACDRLWEKRHWGVPEYSYQEVRDYKCREELAYLVDNYQWDGIFISTRGHRMPAEHGDQYRLQSAGSGSLQGALRRRHPHPELRSGGVASPARRVDYLLPAGCAQAM